MKGKIMIIGKEFLKKYAEFKKGFVRVEIPFISVKYFEELAKGFAKTIILGGLKGEFSFETTPELITGFNYRFGQNESKQKVEAIFEILTAHIMMTYYNQKSRSEVKEVLFSIA